MEREDTVVFYDELGIFKLLSLVSHSAEAKEFEKQYIEKICTYDRKHHTDMMDTFIALVTNGWNLKTSEKLYIHYNSMKYRYRKLGMILELDLQDQEERLNLELALKLYQMHENKNIQLINLVNRNLLAVYFFRIFFFFFHLVQ